MINIFDYACLRGNLKLIKYLVREGVNIHTLNEGLMEVCYHGYFEIAKFLVEKGANIHAKNSIALYWASEFGHFEIVKFLVEKGANKNVIEDKTSLRYLEWINKIKNKKASLIQRYWRFQRNKNIN